MVENSRSQTSASPRRLEFNMKLGSTFNNVGTPSEAVARVAGLSVSVACVAACAQG